MLPRIATVLVVAALVCSVSEADRLVLKKGDTLTGSMVVISDSTLNFRSSIGGRIMAPLDEISRLTTDSDVIINLNDGTSLSGRLEVDDGKLTFTSDDGASRELDPASVADIKPEPIPGEGLQMKLQANLEAGMLWRSGTEDHVDLFAKLTLARNMKTRAFESEWYLQRADSEDFPRWFKGDLFWRAGDLEGAFPFLTAAVERDADNALAFRGDLGAGLGIPLVEERDRRLELQAGLNAETSHYDATPLTEEGILHMPTPDWQKNALKYDEQFLSVRLGLRYSRLIFGKGQFDERLVLYPSLTEWGRIRASSESSLSFPFSSRLRLNFNLLLDYENENELDDLDPWRTSFGASLLWGY